MNGAWKYQSISQMQYDFQTNFSKTLKKQEVRELLGLGFQALEILRIYLFQIWWKNEWFFIFSAIDEFLNA